MKYPFFIGLIGVSLLGSGAGAATISFDSLASTTSDSPFISTAESGFTVTAHGGSWFASTNVDNVSPSTGDPSPSIYEGPVYAPSAGQLSVSRTSDSQTFSFASLELANNAPAPSTGSPDSGPVTYTITGTLNNQTVFTQSGATTLYQSVNGITQFEVINSASSAKIDYLMISFTPSDGTTSYNVDNIVVNVPEPASIGAIGMASLLMMKRRRR